MGAAGGEKQHIKPAVQQFGQVVGDFEHHHVVADRRLTQLARRSSGRFQETRRNSQAELSAAQRRRSLFRRPGNEVECGRDRGKVGLPFIGQDQAARQPPKQRDAERPRVTAPCWLTAPGVTPSSAAARVKLRIAHGVRRRAGRSEVAVDNSSWFQTVRDRQTVMH